MGRWTGGWTDQACIGGVVDPEVDGWTRCRDDQWVGRPVADGRLWVAVAYEWV